MNHDEQRTHVTLSGPPASGKSSIARALADRGFAVVSGGDLFRAEAAARHMDVAALGEAMLADRGLADQVNQAVDSRVEAAAAMPGRVVIDARTAFARDPGAMRVYVDCPLDERARRAAKSTRASEDYGGSVQAAEDGLRRRDAFEAAEMGRLVGADVTDMGIYDLVADSRNYSPAEIATCIAEVATAREEYPSAPIWVALAMATASYDVPDALGVAHDFVEPTAAAIPVGARLDRDALASAGSRGPWLDDSGLLVYYPTENVMASCVYYTGSPGFSTRLAAAEPGRLGAYEPTYDAGVLWGYPNAAACLAGEGLDADAIVLASDHITLPDGRREDIPEFDGTPIDEEVVEALESVLSSSRQLGDRC